MVFKLKMAVIHKLEEMQSFYNIETNFSKIEFSHLNRDFTPEIREEIDGQLLKLNKDYGNKPLICMHPEMNSLSDDTLHLAWHTCSFGEYIATKEHSSIRFWATGIAGITRFKENDQYQYIFGERHPGKNLFPGLETVPGGFLELSLMENFSNPCVECLLKEFEEEIGLPREHVARTSYLHIAQIRQDKISLRFYQDLCIDLLVEIENITQNQVLDAFSKNKKKEHLGLEIVPSDKFQDYVGSNINRFPPRTINTLITFLKKHEI